ncbi:(3R)-3-hydroxyacyl-CoA dehydrogenase-like [Ixodes scapularis]|uniref:(3R)-3-hydroxyacyl-CoA dehydrogenase-like n=1 Tax=Ixodes scapularis TaxID=6945 RepID=UPI001A9F83DF|nr:(3R)-3-hydroxyacyl-CoA dehydrogenase-like [Ixodes scapularis]
MIQYYRLNHAFVWYIVFFITFMMHSSAEDDVNNGNEVAKEVENVKKISEPLLAGKLAIVTGGASGIGRSVCQVLDREGATVVVADINDTGSAETIKLLSRERNHTAIHTDVTIKENVTYLFKQVASSYEMSLSIVVNSAGIVHNASGVQNVPEAVFDKVIGVNFKGTYLVTKEAVTLMLQKNATGRAILNIASVSGKGGYPFLSAYSASKGAVISFTKSVALEVALKGIRVNTILPGYADTPMTQGTPNATKQRIISTIPMKRMATALEISETIVFMCGPRSTYMTGSSVLVSGGSYL